MVRTGAPPLHDRQGYALLRRHVTYDGPYLPREIALSKRQPRLGCHLCIDNIVYRHRFFLLPVVCATMARLTTRLSATPLRTRETTQDSLYRDPSVAPQHASNARGSTRTTYSVVSPSQSSDKENMDSESREGTPQPAKRKGLGSASGRIPTPDTGSTTDANNKRRRTGNYSMNGASELYQDEDEDEAEEEGEEEELEHGRSRRQTTTQPEEEEDSQSKLYNPNQDPEKRREVRYQLRDNHRQLEGE